MAAFAVTGAFKAVEHKSDIVGMIILASITGLAGGMAGTDLADRLPLRGTLTRGTFGASHARSVIDGLDL